jgi:hypothetical protein
MTLKELADKLESLVGLTVPNTLIGRADEVIE